MPLMKGEYELNLGRYVDRNKMLEVIKGTRENNWGYNATSNFKGFGKELAHPKHPKVVK